MAIKSFKNQTTQDIFLGDNTKAARRVPQRVWTSARRRLELLHSAAKLSDLSAMPGLRVEPLKYDRPGFHSIRINDQFRVIFRFHDGDAYDVEVSDPKHHQP